MVNKLNVILSRNINQTKLDRNLRVLSLHFKIMAVVGNLELVLFLIWQCLEHLCMVTNISLDYCRGAVFKLP